MSIPSPYNQKAFVRKIARIEAKIAAVTVIGMNFTDIWIIRSFDEYPMLFMIPSDEEINDNIVAFWTPETPPAIGEPLRFDYRMIWHYFSDGKRPPAGWVTATYTAAGKGEDRKKFVVEFSGEALAAMPEDEPLHAVVDVSPNAKVTEHQLHKNLRNNQWRLVFEIDQSHVPADQRKNAVELRAFLKRGEDVLTETWSYVYQP